MKPVVARAGGAPGSCGGHRANACCGQSGVWQQERCLPRAVLPRCVTCSLSQERQRTAMRTIATSCAREGDDGIPGPYKSTSTPPAHLYGHRGLCPGDVLYCLCWLPRGHAGGATRSAHGRGGTVVHQRGRALPHAPPWMPRLLNGSPSSPGEPSYRSATPAPRDRRCACAAPRRMGCVQGTSRRRRRWPHG
jgi:hypothetical protein